MLSETGENWLKSTVGSEHSHRLVLLVANELLP